MSLPRIVIITTGGTIAAAASTATQTAVYELKGEPPDLLAAVPGLGSVAEVSCERLVNVPSHELGLPVLLDLARRINGRLADERVDGVVVTHGTDTIEETAYFLHLVIKSAKPVVLVGAARPSTALSADGPLNLFNALRLAGRREARGQGVLVLLNDRIGSARFVTKGHTSAPDALRSPEQGFLGTVTGDVIAFEASPRRKHTLQTPFEVGDLTALPPVDVVYATLGMGVHLIEAAVRAGAKGVVFAATGNGSLSEAMKGAAERCRAAAVVFVRSSRTGSGSVSPLPLDAELGTIAAGSLNPQKARILLMLALTITRDRGRLQSFFDEH